MAKLHKGTSTSSFGVSRRENHDASDFYERFVPPIVDPDAAIHPDKKLNEIFIGDARQMPEVAGSSVGLVVTSPPYFAGKEYELGMGHGLVPASYVEFLQMLEEVFSECVRTLEPGGRIAVNVANLGRRPYRSLSADVIGILQDRLGLLLRGEVIWQKARGSAGSCAWGSFQSPANPVLRDLTERVIIASKGRFDRALSSAERLKEGLPAKASIGRDEFMEATTDVWEIPAESAGRVGHPAPFPVPLVERLIHLHTYEGDLVLDPFMGSGTSAIAAIRTGRNFAGYETDAGYARAARARIADELAGHAPEESRDEELTSAKELGRARLEAAGFQQIDSKVSVGRGLEFSFRALDGAGQTWYFDVCGGFTTNRPGLNRTEVLWRSLGKAAALSQLLPGARLVLLAADVPAVRSEAAAVLNAVTGNGKLFQEIVRLAHKSDQHLLEKIARGLT